MFWIYNFKKFGGVLLNMKTKLLAALLIFVFVASVSSVVAEDVADASEELAIDNVDETIAVSEDVEPLAAEEETQDTSTDGDTEPTEPTEPTETTEITSTDYSNMTSVGVIVKVLDKNVKVGDKVRVKITVKNFGDKPAENVRTEFSFSDLQGNPDFSFKLLNAKEFDIEEFDGGYVLDFGFLGAGETEDVILTFLATEAGDKAISIYVHSDNTIDEPDSWCNDTFTVSAGSVAKDKAAASKTLHATGNPLALLAIALFCIVPYYRRR